MYKAYHSFIVNIGWISLTFWMVCVYIILQLQYSTIPISHRRLRLINPAKQVIARRDAGSESGKVGPLSLR